MFEVIVRNSYRDDVDDTGGFKYRNHIRAWRFDWCNWLYDNYIFCYSYRSGDDGGCSTVFDFKYEEDAVAFKLVWS